MLFFKLLVILTAVAPLCYCAATNFYLILAPLFGRYYLRHGANVLLRLREGPQFFPNRNRALLVPHRYDDQGVAPGFQYRSVSKTCSQLAQASALAQ